MDQLFACSPPLPTPLAKGNEVATRGSAKNVQQATLYDAATAKTLEELLRDPSRLAAKKAASPFDDCCCLAPSSVSLDQALVDVLVRVQLKKG